MQKKDSTSPYVEVVGTGVNCTSCQSYTFIKKLNKTEGIVRQVNKNEYAYKKQQMYIEIDPKYAAELGEIGSVRIFTCDNSIIYLEYINKKVVITGKLHDCLTDNHGQPTLNFYMFHVLY